MLCGLPGFVPADEAGKAALEAARTDATVNAHAYQELVALPVSWRANEGGAHVVRMGPTAVSKLLFAVAPEEFPAWIVAAQACFDGDYVQYLQAVRRFVPEGGDRPRTADSPSGSTPSARPTHLHLGQGGRRVLDADPSGVSRLQASAVVLDCAHNGFGATAFWTQVSRMGR